SVPDRSRDGLSWHNRARALYAPTTDQEPPLSHERGGRPEQPHQDGMNKTAVLDRGSAAPSSPAPAENGVRATESLCAAILNGLLQQNLHKADLRGSKMEFRLPRESGPHAMSAFARPGSCLPPRAHARRGSSWPSNRGSNAPDAAGSTPISSRTGRSSPL